MENRRTRSSCGPSCADPEQLEPLFRTFDLVSSGKYLGCNGHIAEALFISKVFEGGNHVGLEIIPAKAELLIVSHHEEQTSDQIDLQCGPIFTFLGTELQGHE